MGTQQGKEVVVEMADRRGAAAISEGVWPLAEFATNLSLALHDEDAELGSENLKLVWANKS